MGERNWYERYKDSKQYADDAAHALASGEDVNGWHYEPAWLPNMPEPPRVHLTGAAWVAYLYEIAVENAKTLVSVHGASYQPYVDECERLVREYKEKAV